MPGKGMPGGPRWLLCQVCRYVFLDQLLAHLTWMVLAGPQHTEHTGVLGREKLSPREAFFTSASQE